MKEKFIWLLLLMVLLVVAPFVVLGGLVYVHENANYILIAWLGYIAGTSTKKFIRFIRKYKSNIREAFS